MERPGQSVILALVCSLMVVLGGVAYFAYQYWYIPRWARLRVERLRREEAVGIPPSLCDYHYAIAFDDLGFTVKDLRGRKHETWGMRWAGVRRAIAFKRDFFTVDCICLVLFDAADTGVELDEEMARWNSLIEALPRHLPGCKAASEWWSAVAFPPFATNETEIYGLAQPSLTAKTESPGASSSQ
jgi:hypothetical protein